MTVPMPRLGSFAIVATMLVAVDSARASHLDGFVYDFETTPSWYLDHFSSTPVDAHLFSSGNVLGYFGEETLTFFGMDALEIDALFANKAYLSFDLILFGLDQAQIQIVGNDQILLDATFSNVPEVDQSYPGASSPAGTGSSDFLPPFASAYPLSFTFGFPFADLSEPCCTDVEISISATATGLWGGWGIDNFVISSTPIPEPSTGILTGLGLVAFAARRRLASRLAR
jgi:hypothetical protein